MRKNSYIYKVTLPETGEFYIGSRTCDVLPYKDTRYLGSMTRWQPDKSKLVKEILVEFLNGYTKESLISLEADYIRLYINDPLNRNYNIPSPNASTIGLKRPDTSEYNKLNKTGKPGPTKGITGQWSAWNKGITGIIKASDETKRKMSEVRKGRTQSPEHIRNRMESRLKNLKLKQDEIN